MERAPWILSRFVYNSGQGVYGAAARHETKRPIPSSSPEHIGTRIRSGHGYPHGPGKCREKNARPATNHPVINLWRLPTVGMKLFGTWLEYAPKELREGDPRGAAWADLGVKSITRLDA
ncbi:hypothetical protein KM043_010838 [Ampulex compressa]|nr:hypothetical protein KM043_010838 [Ampulex compressa]